MTFPLQQTSAGRHAFFELAAEKTRSMAGVITLTPRRRSGGTVGHDFLDTDMTRHTYKEIMSKHMHTATQHTAVFSNTV